VHLQNRDGIKREEHAEEKKLKNKETKIKTQEEDSVVYTC